MSGFVWPPIGLSDADVAGAVWASTGSGMQSKPAKIMVVQAARFKIIIVHLQLRVHAAPGSYGISPVV